MLGGSTRLLVTHDPSVLQYTNSIVVMKGGTVVEQGTYKELITKGVLEEFVRGDTVDTVASTGNNRTDPWQSPLELPDVARLTEDEAATAGKVSPLFSTSNQLQGQLECLPSVCQLDGNLVFRVCCYSVFHE